MEMAPACCTAMPVSRPRKAHALRNDFITCSSNAVGDVGNGKDLPPSLQPPRRAVVNRLIINHAKNWNCYREFAEFLWAASISLTGRGSGHWERPDRTLKTLRIR